MKTNRRYFLLISGLLLFASAACSFSATTANIKEAYTARDVDGSIQAATTFAPEDVFYCLVTVANAPDDTVTKAVWKTVEAEGVRRICAAETEFEAAARSPSKPATSYLWPLERIRLSFTSTTNWSKPGIQRGGCCERNRQHG